MPGKWITQGKGTDAKHIMVQDSRSNRLTDLGEENETSVLEYPFPDPEIEALQNGISKLSSYTGFEVDYILHVKETLRDLEQHFGDHEAFEQLMDMVDVVFDSLVQLKQRIRNLNNKGVSEGFSTKYLETRISALTRENELLRGYFEKLPEAATPEGSDLVRSEDLILEKLNESKDVVNGLKDFQGISIPYDNQRDSRDFEHLKRGAINRYIQSEETA